MMVQIAMSARCQCGGLEDLARDSALDNITVELARIRYEREQLPVLGWVHDEVAGRKYVVLLSLLPSEWGEKADKPNPNPSVVNRPQVF